MKERREVKEMREEARRKAAERLLETVKADVNPLRTYKVDTSTGLLESNYKHKWNCA